MQKGYKRQAKGMAVLRCFIGLFIVIVVVLIVSFLLQLDYSDKLAPDASIRPYVETTQAPSLSPSASPTSLAVVDVSSTQAPTEAPTQKPTPTPTPVPTPTPTPTAVPTSIPEASYAAIRADLKFPETPTTTNAKIGVTYSYRSVADDNKVLQLRGYGYIDDAAFDGSTVQTYLVLKRESTGDRAVAMASMSKGVSGMSHDGALCQNADAADFEVVLSADQIPEDIYALGLVISYKVDGEQKFDYVEYPAAVSFTILNGQFLGDVALTD